MIVFCFTCFRCAAVCSVLLLPVSVTLNASQTHSYSWHAHKCLRGITFEDGCMHTGAMLCSLLFFVSFYIFYFIAVCLTVFFFNCFACFLCLPAAGRCVFLALSLICCFWAAVICHCAVVVCGVAAVSRFLLSLYVDGALVCAEGYTQVTGVMAMMMTGRVLLVCALCVLWCGTPGGRCDEGGTGGTPPGASASDVVGKDPQESPPIAQGGSHTSGLKAPGIKNKSEDSDDEQLLTEDEEDEEEEDEDRGKKLQISGKEGIPPPGGGKSEAADGKLEKVNEGGPKPEKQHPVESGAQNTSGKETVSAGEAGVNQQNEGSRLKPQDNPNPVQEENTINGEGHQLTQEKEQKTNVEAAIPINPAGDRSSGEHSNNDGSNEREEKEGEEGVEDHEIHRAQEREEAAHVSGAPKVNSADIQQEV
ncbi:mucin-associated surface protein (MASP) [Trypanosoma cruzi Dm28c]|uniref:Mucin-associated surface protein (MASP) n=1 Tax=Trypanosoma cruzi Dm28c TaxID=1416333 RepID=V5APP8_TRYCR|nr:mucin-associated surface protein (MASP) [Trypanosoma cruzi Dm28c]